MMTNDEFEDRVAAVTWMFGFAGDLKEVIAGKRMVEIGSGFGVGAIACARSGAAHYLGIEPEPFGSSVIRLDGADPGFRVCYETAAQSVDKRKILFLEGFADDWPGGDFDVCLIADVLEHVAEPSLIAASAWRLLKPGGVVIASTSPLYFSAYGHHLFGVFPEQPWAHLYRDFSRADLMGKTSPFLLSEFESLNGVTHEALIDAFASNGFDITKERTLPHQGPPLETVRSKINPDYLAQLHESIFEQELSQIVAQKPTNGNLGDSWVG